MNTDLKDKNIHERIKTLAKPFEDVILHRLGIVMHHQRTEMINTITKGCKIFHYSPEEYLEQLKTSADDSLLLESLIQGITIGETYFFREKSQMKMLYESLLPHLIQQKRILGELNLRIWSAGCSSGEEIYTLAIMLNELLPDLKNWTINLLGSDINSKALQKAIKGSYGEWSMRAIPLHLKKKYFSVIDKEYLISPTIRDLVNFTYINLNADSYPSIFNGTHAQDLILCRNVLIYFDNSLVKTLMQNFFNCLQPGGHLLLGSSDPLDISGTNFSFEHQRGTLFLRPAQDYIIKEKPVKKASPKPQLLVSHARESLLIKPEKIVEQAPLSTATSKSTKSYMNDLHQFIEDGRWEAALDLIQHCEIMGVKSAFVYHAKALAYANLGKLNEAVAACQQSLALGKPEKYIYFTYAMALIGLNRFSEAEATLKKTLFLDHQFVAGHFQLGMLLLRNKNTSQGIKSLKNALMIANTQNPQQIVPGSQGITYSNLAATLKHELELYYMKGSSPHVNEIKTP